MIVETKELTVKEGVEALIDQNTIADRDTVFEAEGDGVGQRTRVFAATEVLALVAGAEAEDRGKDGRVHDGLELFRGLAGGVEGTDHAAHAGARDHINGDVVLFEPLEDSDLGEAESASAAEGESNAGAVGGAGWGWGWSERGRDGGGAVGGFGFSGRLHGRRQRALSERG